MKIYHINTSDISGGASRAAYRLHKGLIGNEINSRMFVQSKQSDDYTVENRANTKYQKLLIRIQQRLDAFPKMFYRNKALTTWSVNLVPNANIEYLNTISPDIIHLHWVNNGFIPIRDLSKLKPPLIWTLHDMWPFTGGCHYAGECSRYLQFCINCPQLGSKTQYDLSRLIWNTKKRSWKRAKFTIVSPSKWLASCAKNSSLFENMHIVTIPNGIDIGLYKPIHKKIAKDILNLPHDKKIILFGAENAKSDARKGFKYLSDSLQYLNNHDLANDIEIVIFGASKSNNELGTNFKISYLGKLHDDITLTLLYSAADIFIAPSIEENLANTVMEALACATPCLAFNIGGMPDMIEHKENGYLAKPLDSQDLANGVLWILGNKERWLNLSQNARNKVVNNYDINIVAQKYISLYGEVMNK